MSCNDNLDADNAWGRLTPLYGDNRTPITIVSDVFTIGRHSDCDLALESVRAISTCHCSIIRDPDGKVWLQDTSTNGTVIDGDTKVKEEVVELPSNSEVYLIHRRKSPSDNVVFLFEDLTCGDGAEDAAERTQPLAEEEEDEEEEEQEQEQELEQEEGEEEEDAVGNEDEAAAEEEEAEATCSQEKGAKRPSPGEDSPVVAAKRARRASSPQPGPSGASGGAPEDKGLLDTLICAICQEILHDCVSVQPCLHSFCAGCFSDWMQNKCPSCRQTCTRVSRNHLVNNIVEEYLKKHPDQRRPQEDIDELDNKNKIKGDVALGGTSPNSSNSSIFSSGSPSSDSSLTFSPRVIGPFLSLISHTPRNYRFYEDPVCRQCPNYQALPTDPPPPFPPPPFVCHLTNTQHVLCQCCLRPMPKRSEPDVLAKQQCALCRAFFCGAYFGCNDTCHGCLAQVKDTSLSGLCENAILNNNPYESRVLIDYLRENNISLQTLMVECAENLTSHTYFAPQLGGVALTATSHVCRGCGQRLLREFAYHYRKAIAPDRLPDSVRNRPDCYWGYRCRTQIRLNHAERYNHICDQTRQA